MFLDFILATLFVVTLIGLLNGIAIFQSLPEERRRALEAFVKGNVSEVLVKALLWILGKLVILTPLYGFSLYISHESFLRVINLFF